MANKGRPTKYNDEILVKTRYYIDSYKRMGKQVPSNQGLALHLGIRRETVQVWAKEEGKEDFSNMLDEIQATQYDELISKGLDGTYNAAIVKLMLTKHGLHDKAATELSGPGGGPIETKWTVEIIDKKGKE